jgi:hypothetical protein
MKKLFIFFLLVVNLTVQATTYYVATVANGGSNSNSGASNSPWSTIYYAITQCNTGDVIYVTAGTYTETQQLQLPVGISITGAGITSIIKSTYVGSLTSGMITMTSSSGTPVNGNQSITNVKIDGNGQANYTGITSSYRYGITIANCTVIDFADRGISIMNGTDFMNAPSYYSTGNSVHDCIVTNCGHYDAYYSEYAGVWWYGQNGFLLYNNTLDNTAQGSGNADNIKCAWHYNTSIYNNVMTKPIGDNGGQWNFYSELFFTIGQFDIYNNTFNGNATFDIVDVRPGAGNWCNVHNNTWTNASQCVNTSSGIQCIDFEDWGAVQRVRVYNNHFKNNSTGILFDVKGDATGKVLISGKVHYEYIYIYYNLFEGMGNTTNTYSSAIDVKPEYSDALCFIDNIYIDNNTIISGSTYKGYAGVIFEKCSSMTNFYVRNNIIKDFNDYSIAYTTQIGTPSGATHTIQENICYGNGNNAVYGAPSGVNYTPSGGIYSTSNPLFVSGSDFRLQAGSPARDAGVDVGLTSDYLGYTVPFNTIPDIGAYEYGASGNTTPTVTTISITSITTTTAAGGGNVTSDGGASVTARGVCWSTSSNPVTSNSHTSDGTSTGTFSSSITGLTAGTAYYVRAYATNNIGTSYGSNVQFTSAVLTSAHPVAVGSHLMQAGGHILIVQ